MEKWRLLDFTNDQLTTARDIRKRAANRIRIALQKDEYKAPKVTIKKESEPRIKIKKYV